jgi:two-component system sensor histidine kinase RpfC
VTLSSSIVESQQDGCIVRIEVKDTGIGIASAKQIAIFEPFAQADDSVTRVYGGTGLGTTIARQLVSLMGGTIGLQSELGKGSLFWVEIALKRSEPQGIDFTEDLAASPKSSATAQALAAIQSSKVHRIRGARILVAEDNATNQRVAQLILESGSHIVTIVENGEAALDALEGASFDLALFDLSMPVVSGLQALKLYRFTTSRPIPVLILSANVTTEIIAECENAGAAEFIPKPLRASHLLDAVERHLSSEVAVASRPERTDASNRSRGPSRPRSAISRSNVRAAIDRWISIGCRATGKGDNRSANTPQVRCSARLRSCTQRRRSQRRRYPAHSTSEEN